MSKYSDHTTVGGQVLAHRVRMMKQNWRIIFMVGYFGGLAFFFGSMFYCWKPNEIWNYLCCLKASYRVGLPWLSSKFLNTSYILSDSGVWGLFADRAILLDKGMVTFKIVFEQSLFFNIKLSVGFAVFATIIMVYINKRLGKSLSDSKELLSGHDYVEGDKIKKHIKEKSDITLSGIPYPKETECRHTILTGTTGSGKTNVMIELLDQAVAKNEKIVIVDTIGTFVNRYYKKDRDIILNPIDEDGRHVYWSFLNECTEDILIKSAAACFIDSGNAHDKFWEDAARIVFVETAKKAIKEGKTTAEFLDILLKIKLEEIEKYLEGTYGHSLMDKRADKMAISIRATLINAISIFDILKESDSNNFSIKNWITNPDQKGILFLSCTPAQRATLIPIITTWLSIATEYLLHTKPTSERTWFFIDELHNLKRLPKLESSLAEVRKFGGCFVMGTQIVSQLNSIYTREVARTIMGLCDTKIVMRIPEPETARYMSTFLGEKEEVSTTEGISYGANTIRDGVNIAQKTDKKSTVLPAEIMDLKSGEAFIRFSGVDMIAKTKFKLHKIGTEKRKERNRIISLQEYISENPTNENDLLLYGIPLNDSILSNPIYVFDDDLSNISKMLQMARIKNKKVVVFEDSDNLYKNCFQRDILLNPHQENSYAWDMLGEFEHDYIRFINIIWDMLGEFEHDYIRFINIIINSVDFSEKEKDKAQIFLAEMMINISKIVDNITTHNVLNALIFQPIKTLSAVLIDAIDENYNIEKYSDIRTKMALYLQFLKPIETCNKEISIREYINSDTYNGKILFVSCFNKKPAIEVSKMILDNAELINVMKIFYSQNTYMETKNSIIIANNTNGFLNISSTVIASHEQILKRNFLSELFKDAIVEGNLILDKFYITKIT